VAAFVAKPDVDRLALPVDAWSSHVGIVAAFVAKRSSGTSTG
jgi:hypothetical protein